MAFLTSGELGLKHLSREEAWRVREAEAEAAAAVLGVARLVFLRGPDWVVGNHVADVAAGLGPVLEQEAPSLVYLPHAGDDHPDHRAALPVLRHRLMLKPEADLEGVTPDQALQDVIRSVEVPR